MKKKITLSILLSLLLNIGIISGQDVNEHLKQHQLSDWYLQLKSDAQNYFSITTAFEDYFKTREYVKTDAVREYIRWTRALSGNYDAQGNLLTIQSNPQDLQILTKKQINLKVGGNTGNWEQIGPFTFDMEANYRTNTQGVVRCIQQAPGNPSKVLIGCISGGVWLSTNSGDNWTNVTKDLLVSTVTGVCMAPSDNNIAYAACQEGVIKSVDGGLTWDFTAMDDRINYPNGSQPTAIAVAHDNASKVLYTSKSGLWVSADGGDTWSQKFSSHVYDVEFHPTNSNIAYATVQEGTWTAFYKTSDGGNNWTSVTNGYPEPIAGHEIKRSLIEVSAAAADAVWIVSGGKQGTEQGVYGVFKSTNAGDSFINIYQAVPGVSGSPNFLARATNGLASEVGQLSWDMAFAVSETDPDYMIAGTINVWKSTDGGYTWSYVNRSSSGNTMYHMDFQCAEIYDNNTWIGTDGGIGLSSDKMANLQDKSFGGFAAQQIWGVDRSWKNDIMNAGLYHGQIIMRDGNTYQGGWYNIMGADASSTYINYGDDRYMYANSYGGRRVIRSTDRNTQAQTARMPVNTPKGYKQNEMLNHFYYGENFTHTDNIFKKSIDEDALKEWSVLYTFTNKLTNIHPSYESADILYVVEQNNKLWRTEDGGLNWEDRTPPNEITQGYSLGNVSTDGKDANIIWCSIQGKQSDVKVLKSLDGGATWADYSGPDGNLPSYEVLSLAHQLGTDGGVYIGNSAGIWYRNNTMTEWVNFSNGLPAATPVTHIRFKYAEGKITIGSLRSIFEGDVYEASTPIAHPITAQKVNDLGPVKFVDHSVCASGATFSWSFPGGTPASSIEENPVIEYNTVGTYDVTLTVTDANGSSSQTFPSFIEVQEPVVIKLDAAYDFNGNANDITGNGWNATEDNGIAFINDAERGMVANFNQTYSVVTNHKGWEGSAPRTISLWVKTTASERVFTSMGTKAAASKFVFLVNSSGQLRLEVEAGYAIGTGTVVNDGDWHHVAVTYDGTGNVGNVKFYIDGQADLVSATNGQAVNTSPGVDMRIGYDIQNENRTFIGQIDDLYFWDRALTPEEINEIYGTALGFEEIIGEYIRLTGEQLNLKIENSGKQTPIKIFDITGNCVNSFDMPSGSKTISFSQSGIYIVAIYGEKRIQTKKILITN